ncbi:MAG: hypothetical protein WCJ66_15730, partial [Verrucomicrobiota bacterium]
TATQLADAGPKPMLLAIAHSVGGGRRGVSDGGSAHNGRRPVVAENSNDQREKDGGAKGDRPGSHRSARALPGFA